MKTIKYMMAAAACCAMALSACHDDNSAMVGEGTLCINASISGDTKNVAISRADLREELGESLILWISNSKGPIRAYNGIDNVPSSLTLLSGSYVAEAWAGDSVPASWDKRWFKGSADFTIAPGATANVNLVCKIANVVVATEYAEDVDAVLEDYTITVNHSRGKLVFDDEHQRGYFMMPSADQDLTYTLTGTKKLDGALYTKTGTIKNVQAAHEYTLKVSCAQDETEIGGGFLNIVIDDKEIETTDETVLITLAPMIQGYDFDINQTYNAEPGSFSDMVVYIVSSGSIEQAIIECQQFEAVFGEAGAVDFDAIAVLNNPTLNQQLKDAGINLTYAYDATADNSIMSVALGENFLNENFVEDGEVYSVKFSVKDSNGKTSERTLKVAINGDLPPIVVEPVGITGLAPAGTSTTVTGTILNAKAIGDITAINVYYAQGAGLSRTEWSSVEATVSGTSYSATITGLEPDTDYSYYAEVQGTNLSEPYLTEVLGFTTEATPQLPNAGFEYWNTTSTPYLIYAEGQQMFWDSGNHGSATMSKNVTTPDSSVKHSGEYSVKMASQFVGMFGIGKFAAGNAFVGKYLGTDGMDGILGWGRPFSGRPAKLRGWVKYSPVAVDYTSAARPDIVKGEMDQGIIYIALLDGTTDTEYPEFPVVIKTKTQQLFDKNGANVIAYGEKLFDATPGDDMIEFEIPLDYYRVGERPVYILLTCAASKGGDYFAGGNGSNMWVDDLELIYE